MWRSVWQCGGFPSFPAVRWRAAPPLTQPGARLPPLLPPPPSPYLNTQLWYGHCSPGGGRQEGRRARQGDGRWHRECRRCAGLGAATTSRCTCQLPSSQLLPCQVVGPSLSQDSASDRCLSPAPFAAPCPFPACRWLTPAGMARRVGSRAAAALAAPPSEHRTHRPPPPQDSCCKLAATQGIHRHLTCS